MKKKASILPIVFINDGFDWEIKGNRYYVPFFWSKLTKTLVITRHASFLHTLKYLLARKRYQVVEKMNKNLTIYRPPGLLPLNKTLEVIEIIVEFLNTLIIKLFFTETIRQKSILWFFYPHPYNIYRKIPHGLIVYHVVDYYAKSPTAEKNIEKADQKLAQEADIILVSSVFLRDKYKKYNQNTFYIGNASNTALILGELEKKQDPPHDIKNIPKPIAGFVGNMQDFRFNVNLINYLAKVYPYISFVFIGPSGKFVHQSISKLANIFFLGYKDQSQITRYLKECNVFLIPYLSTAYSQGILPLKLFDYFAFGKNIVSANLSSLKPFSSLIYLSSDKEEFARNLLRALSEHDATSEKRRIQLARMYTWEKLVLKTKRIIEKELFS